MATYLELRAAAENDQFRIKVGVAACIKAAAVLTETAGTNLIPRQKWAASVLADPDSAARNIINAVLAVNAAITPVTLITGASDATVQASVNTVCEVLANYGD